MGAVQTTAPFRVRRNDGITLSLTCLTLRPIFTFKKISLRAAVAAPLRGSGPDIVWQSPTRALRARAATRGAPVPEKLRMQPRAQLGEKRVGYHTITITTTTLCIRNLNHLKSKTKTPKRPEGHGCWSSAATVFVFSTQQK